MAQLAD